MRLMIEVIPFGFPWVSYKETLVRLRVKLVRYQSLDIDLATPNLEKR